MFYLFCFKDNELNVNIPNFSPPVYNRPTVTKQSKPLQGDHYL